MGAPPPRSPPFGNMHRAAPSLNGAFHPSKPARKAPWNDDSHISLSSRPSHALANEERLMKSIARLRDDDATRARLSEFVSAGQIGARRGAKSDPEELARLRALTTSLQQKLSTSFSGW